MLARSVHGPLSGKGLVGCSVSTDPGSLAEYGAHRAPYETVTATSETDSKRANAILGLSFEHLILVWSGRPVNGAYDATRREGPFEPLK